MDTLREIDQIEVTKTEPKKSTFWSKFLNFLMYGGFILILILGVLIAVGISILLNNIK
jgi:hypothetical protein